MFIAYIFLAFSGMHKVFFGSLKDISMKIIGVTALIGIVLGLFFYLVKEPVPNYLLMGTLSDIAFYTIILSISEQIIFSGFLFNIYRKLTNDKDVYFQVATIFVLFHLLRFENLVISYFKNFDFSYLYLITAYYILLFIFMLTALYLYSFKSKKYKGNFVYPVILHFVTDLTLFVVLMLSGGYL